MKVFSRLFIAFLTLGIIGGCSTDVELNADWRNITVVYGLLDKNDTYHYVKINKAYLGDGNALTYAAIRDSSEYAPGQMTAYIDEKINGNVVRTFPLRDTVLNNKSANGIFYSPTHTVYYFVANDLDEAATYELKIQVNGAEDLITAETPLVQDFVISRPFANIPGAPAQTQITFANANSSSSGQYPSEAVKWGEAPNGTRYEVKLVFNYIERTTTGSTNRALEWNIATVQDGAALEKSIDGEQFYTWVRDKIASEPALNPSDLVSRKIQGLDFSVTVAGEDLDTYIDVNQPVTGVVQERPEFTNVTNGIGLFSTRSSEVVTNKWLNKGSIEELCKGQYTYSMEFCTDSAMWPGITTDPQVWCP